MIAIINDPGANIEEILEDINNQLEEAIENGATEEYIYREMAILIKEYSCIQN